MATTYENMVLREMHRHEHQSKKEWGKQHAPDSSVFGLDTSEFARLEGLKEKVADLCDLQPTPAAMVRPPRKVRATSDSRTLSPPVASREIAPLSWAQRGLHEFSTSSGAAVPLLLPLSSAYDLSYPV